MKDILKQIVEGKDLEQATAEQAMRIIMTGQATSAQIGGFLTALRMKGEKSQEIAALARIMRSYCMKITPKIDSNAVLVDTCGTGGDLIKTFNVSTISALVLAGAGISVAKHGNRSVTSTCGSADILEGFGVNIGASPKIVQKCIEKVGIGFMFAPVFHPAMKHVMPSRKEMGIRTVFNILGPLTNPASASAQILGLFNPSLTEKMAETLRHLGVERALTFYGEPGLDEISNIGPTIISELKNGEITNYRLKVKDFGIQPAIVDDIRGSLVEKNLKIAMDIFNGEKSPKTDIVLMNCAAGLYVADKTETLKDGIEQSRDIINTGKPVQKLKALIKTSGGNLTNFEKLEK